MTRGRLAPSPTGDMHLGNARTALLAWLAVRSQHGTMVMRVEDLDQNRTVPGAEQRIQEDLRALGLDWDEGPGCGGGAGPYRQSERLARYQDALDILERDGHIYPCACSRADVLRAASAPHGDDEGPRYGGTCRERSHDEVFALAHAQGRQPCWRFRADAETIWFDDVVAGRQGSPPDDFVVRRSDGVMAYQLAVVVDDAAMNISEVVRGDDLLTSTPRQIALCRALGLPVPRYAHVPLVLGDEGQRLAKRTRPPSVRQWLERGVSPEVIVGRLAASADLVPPGARVAAADLIADFSLTRVRRLPVTLSMEDLPAPH